MAGSSARVVALPSPAAEELAAYCIRCHTAFMRPVQPGRPALYCTPQCRAEGYRELRTARARLAHHEGLVTELRRTVLHLERGDDESSDEHDRQNRAQQLRSALDRAQGTLDALAGSDERSLPALEALVAATALVLADDQAQQ